MGLECCTIILCWVATGLKGLHKHWNRKLLDREALKARDDSLSHEELKKKDNNNNNNNKNNLTDLGQAPVMRGRTGKCEGACQQT